MTAAKPFFLSAANCRSREPSLRELRQHRIEARNDFRISLMDGHCSRQVSVAST
ncbi:hypothetical protein [Bradyrhizobium cytisi]|uniref:hypothetical protein n=1 Tax=Bradyrhizobium cytisi TaxID=515489 RepID=UPI001652BB36|nr:hypothetical protein [Bradyrhizobium cytisi]